VSRLTIAGRVRGALLVWLRGPWEELCTRVAWSALLRGPSASPLEGTLPQLSTMTGGLRIL
jgi:hypothetical protein